MPIQKEPLDWLENIQSRAKQLRAEESEVKKQIRDGFVDCAIVFMDVVGSTAFKQNYLSTPEVWILRVRQFSELLAEAVSRSNGSVVKYIGDEVMAVFNNVYDAQNLVGRIHEIEENLAEATGFETRIKVSADYGKAYFLRFPGHDELDPQGPVVDRCARIGKYGMPGPPVSG
jgi:class 3 adenylate cyclase